MSAYVLLVLGTVIISSLFTSLLPSGKMQNAVKGAVKILCVLTIVSPILLFLTNHGLGGFNGENLDAFFLANGIEMDFDFIKYYSEQRVENAERSLQKELQERFDVSVNVEFAWTIVETEIAYIYSDSQIKIEKVKIILEENINEVIQSKMLTYIKENYCSEVLIE